MSTSYPPILQASEPCMSPAPPQGGRPPCLPPSLRFPGLSAVGRGEGPEVGRSPYTQSGRHCPFRHQLLPEAWLGALRAKQFMGTEERAAGGSLALWRGRSRMFLLRRLFVSGLEGTGAGLLLVSTYSNPIGNASSARRGPLASLHPLLPQAGCPGRDVDGNCQQTLFKYLPTVSLGGSSPISKTREIQGNSNG